MKTKNEENGLILMKSLIVLTSTEQIVCQKPYVVFCWLMQMWLFPQGPCIMASPHGGVNIEEVAKEKPSELFKEGVDITEGKKFEFKTAIKTSTVLE